MSIVVERWLWPRRPATVATSVPFAMSRLALVCRREWMFRYSGRPCKCTIPFNGQEACLVRGRLLVVEISLCLLQMWNYSTSLMATGRCSCKDRAAATAIRTGYSPSIPVTGGWRSWITALAKACISETKAPV